MNDYKFLISIIMVLCLVVWIEGNDGICNKTKIETKYRDEEEQFTELKSFEVKCKRTLANLFKTKKNCTELRNVTSTRIVQKPYEVEKIVKTCCKGYDRLGNRCVPICQLTCENAKCTGPDVCTCNKGYTLFSTYRCVPACENCEHGQCVAPGVCDCYNGYKMIDGAGCQPICDPPCSTGVCTEPNVCDENEDYEIIDRSFNITDNEYDSLSEEISKKFTTTPKNIVTTTDLPLPSPSNPCHDGFTLDTNGQCRLQCEIDCHYGVFQHGQCICTEGFRNSPVNPCICEPHCDNECFNGLCTGNNTCLCDDGYKLNPEDNFICLDSNTCHCINGDCTDADHCSCWSGYKLEYSERNYHRCEPLCGDPNMPEGCVNGKCIAPFLCQCNEGYIHGPNNNFTCYADMNCAECIKNGLNCLPGCYTTTSTTTSTSTETIKIIEETTQRDYDEDYETFSTENSDYLDESALIVKSEKEKSDDPIWFSTFILGPIAIVLLLIVIIAFLILKRINKPIDYDVNQREHSENNVYFIKRQDDVKLNL